MNLLDPAVLRLLLKNPDDWRDSVYKHNSISILKNHVVFLHNSGQKSKITLTFDFLQCF